MVLERRDWGLPKQDVGDDAPRETHQHAGDPRRQWVPPVERLTSCRHTREVGCNKGQYMSILFHIYSLNESSLTGTYQMTSKRNLEVTNMPSKCSDQIILLVRSFCYIMI